MGLNAQQINYSVIPRKDTANIYQEMLNDKSDDLMENHPADDIYNNIWTSEKLNPYKIPIDSLPDTVRIDCKDFSVPVPGMITSDFGPRRYRYHYGTDLRLNVGDSIHAAFSGKVRIIDYEARGYGHYVVIRHDNGLETVYAHLSQVMVKLDQVVKGGELIALGGNTGRSTGPHLHFEMRYLGNAINPASIVNFYTGHVHNDIYQITKRKSFYYQHGVKAQQAAKYYKVRKGDTLGQIALRNGTSVKALCRLNSIKSKKLLQPGQKIRVR
ncbi:MAG: peptidoglycan DD-metalloendopeptidase family protein [Bacteroidales bacterium]|nr:peptidoglycan DD-metalloendopeptidase family protein [Bacteroidales bacterium]